jgi:hypothetical protein
VTWKTIYLAVSGVVGLTDSSHGRVNHIALDAFSEEASMKRDDLIADFEAFFILVVMPFIVLMLLSSFPTCWGLCLRMFDMRTWTNGMWSCIAVVLMGIFLLIRWRPGLGR